MTSLESILNSFYFESMNQDRYPKFGKPGRQQYLFTCKRCGSTSEPMDFHRNIRYRLVSHLVNHCKRSSSYRQQQQEKEQQQQGPE